MKDYEDTWMLASRMMTVESFQGIVDADGTRRTEISGLKIDGTPEDLTALRMLLGETDMNHVKDGIAARPTENSAETGKTVELSQVPKISEYVELYISRNRKSGSKASDKTLMNYVKTVKLFTRMFGDLPVDQYTEEMAIDFREKLRMLPLNINKVLPWKNMEMDAILEAEDVEKTLSPKTVKDHLIRMKALFRDIAERKMITFNIFKDVNIIVEVSESRKFMPFDRKELRKLFSEDSMDINHAMPSRYWVPLIALYTGMRRSEIFFRTPSDIKIEHNIEFFDVNAEGDKRTKNAASIRKIPIHSDLIQLGFLTYVQRIQDMHGADASLFSEYGNRNGQAGNKFSDWFTRYRKSLGINGAGKVFHSFRSNFVNELERHRCDPLQIQRLTGHASNSITHDATKGYGGKFSIEDLKKTIEHLAFSDVMQALPQWRFR